MAVELDWSNWPGFSSNALAMLEAYPWPGNVRELRNVVERAVYRAEDPEREVDSIQFDPFASPWVLQDDPAGAVEVAAHAAEPAAIHAAPAPALPTTTSDLRGAVNAYEKALLEDALSRHRFNQRSTAAALGLSYDQLRHAMKRHQLAVSG
jgi:psp operon transcriptional activator